MIGIIVGTALGTLLSIVLVHYVRVGLKRWVRK